MSSLLKWLRDLLALLRRLCKFMQGQQSQPSCNACPPALKKPDPFLYSQQYLMSLGLPVTWDNPDIYIYHGTTLVDPHDLEASTDYTVVARIWNNSTDVPVIDLGVHFSYLSFGAGTQSHPVGDTTANLGAKGLAGCPAFASTTWTTPSALGHYCLQVLLEPPDDSNWQNNLGQRNTDVAQPASPAAFVFSVGNHGRGQRPRHVRFGIDTYAIAPVPSCERRMPDEYRRLQLSRAAAPVPAGWIVDLDPSEFVLAPDEEKPVHAVITPPAGFSGQMAFNVTARDDTGPFGGVTLTVEVP
jgi:hypothetical protein